MDDFADGVFDDRPTSEPRSPGRAHRRLPNLGVHVLSEFVFCPRAAILAWESERGAGSDEPFLGPSLSGVETYDEMLFRESLHQQWGDLRFWLTLMLPCILAMMIAWHWYSGFAALICSLPLFYLTGRCWDTLSEIAMLIRERAAYRAADVVDIDLAPTEVRKINWWSLRKSGFDCFKLRDALCSVEERLVGNPWRVLRKGTTISIPVITRHSAERDWGRQHEMRVAAYCRLLEQCEGRSAPFGLIFFAGSYDCVIIPNSVDMQSKLATTLNDLRQFLELHALGTHAPNAPTDKRCSGCGLGEPRRFQSGSSETVLKSGVLPPYLPGNPSRSFHCSCGDRFRWIPPHKDAIALRLVNKPS